jgi:hypothetical protein
MAVLPTRPKQECLLAEHNEAPQDLGDRLRSSRERLGLSGDRAQEQCAGTLRPSVPPAGWDCGAPALRRLVGYGIGIVEPGRPLGQDPK